MEFLRAILMLSAFDWMSNEKRACRRFTPAQASQIRKSILE
jgi:hypothetical protein